MTKVIFAVLLALSVMFGYAGFADAQNRLLDLNTATAEELASLPRIGPSKARAIIEYRASNRFDTVEELDAVPGIGPAIMAAVRSLVTVGR